MTPERFEELKKESNADPRLAECMLEILRLQGEAEYLEGALKVATTPRVIEAMAKGDVTLRHKMLAIFAAAFSTELEESKAENFVTAEVVGTPSGNLIITIRRATGLTPEEKWSQTVKLLDKATDEPHNCRQIIADHLKGSEDERVMEQLTLHVLSQEFTCPKCGGHYFGRDTKAGDDGKVVVLDTVHCNGNSSGKPFLNCNWTGIWPAK